MIARLLIVTAVVLSVVSQDDDSFVDSQSNLASCSESLDSVACIRTDSPKPTSYCAVRDPDSKKCLQAIYFQNESLQHEIEEHQGQSTDVQEIHGGGQGGYYPDPVPELIQEMLHNIRAAGPNHHFLVFIDAEEGSDQTGTGSELRPFRSLRAGLSRWLAPRLCAPYCASNAAGASGTVIARPGIYFGDSNRNIDLLLFDGAHVTVRCADIAPVARGTGVEFRIDPPGPDEGTADPPPPFFIRAAGSGRISLLGLSLANSSSDALIMTGDVDLVTDLFFPHGRSGTWAQQQQVGLPLATIDPKASDGGRPAVVGPTSAELSNSSLF